MKHGRNAFNIFDESAVEEGKISKRPQLSCCQRFSCSLHLSYLLQVYFHQKWYPQYTQKINFRYAKRAPTYFEFASSHSISVAYLFQKLYIFLHTIRSHDIVIDLSANKFQIGNKLSDASLEHSWHIHYTKMNHTKLKWFINRSKQDFWLYRRVEFASIRKHIQVARHAWLTQGVQCSLELGNWIYICFSSPFKTRFH